MQYHVCTLNIMFNIFLAGLRVLISSATCVNELKWACGRMSHLLQVNFIMSKGVVNLSKNLKPFVVWVSVFVTSDNLLNRCLIPMPSSYWPQQKLNGIYLTLRFLFYKYSVFEATLVFKAATKKTIVVPKQKPRALFNLLRFFFFDRLHAPMSKMFRLVLFVTGLIQILHA